MDSQKTVKELPACPVETTLTLIGDKWKVLILRDLLTGTKRFGELKKSVGNVSQKVLTAQLRAMEQNGLLIRTVYAQVPPRVEYTLTELGRSLRPILDAMSNWGEGYKALSPLLCVHVSFVLVYMDLKRFNTETFLADRSELLVVWMQKMKKILM